MINLFFLNDFLFQFILILGATNLFMYSLSAYYVYFNDKEDDDLNKDKKKENQEKLEAKPIPIPYEEKYVKEYKKRCEDQNNNNNNSTEKEKEKRNLKTSFLIEKTPLGNVAMYYNQERECFEYYSDNTIPYRYLETVGRKYVLTFDCVELYIDMEEEVQKQKEKLEEKKRFEKEAKEAKEMEELIKKETKDPMAKINNTNETKESKKNVFAKLKNYNKSSNPIQASSQPTRQNQDQEINKPQDQIQNIKKPNTIRYNQTNSNSSTILLKERANNYLSKGRFSNLTFLQAVKKEIFDKNYKMSFKDFKGRGTEVPPTTPTLHF
jgi:hypothetical protein